MRYEAGKEVTFVSCMVCQGQNLLGVCMPLDVIVESNSGDTSIAIGLKSKITKFQFIMSLFTVLTVLSKTNALSEHLQVKTQTLQQATSLIKATFTSLESLRNVDTEYENIFAKAK